MAAFRSTLKKDFSNGQNRVLNQLKVSSDLLYQISKHEFARKGTLEDLTNFENRIYRADKFFKALDALSEEVRRGVIARPEVLLKIPGRIIRVGISDETLFGFIELGFEFEAVEQKKIFFIQGAGYLLILLGQYWPQKIIVFGNIMASIRFEP